MLKTVLINIRLLKDCQTFFKAVNNLFLFDNILKAFKDC